VMYKGREFSIAFNPEFLMAPLRNLSEAEIYLERIDEMSPGVIKMSGPFLYVLMPVRLSQATPQLRFFIRTQNDFPRLSSVSDL